MTENNLFFKLILCNKFEMWGTFLGALINDNSVFEFEYFCTDCVCNSWYRLQSAVVVSLDWTY